MNTRAYATATVLNAEASNPRQRPGTHKASAKKYGLEAVDEHPWYCLYQVFNLNTFVHSLLVQEGFWTIIAL